MCVAFSFLSVKTVVMLIWSTMSAFFYQFLFFLKPQWSWPLKTTLQPISGLLTFTSLVSCVNPAVLEIKNTGWYKQRDRAKRHLLLVPLTSLSPKGLGNTKWTQITVSWKIHRYCFCFSFVKAAVPQTPWRCSAECQAICWCNNADHCMSEPHFHELVVWPYHTCLPLRDVTEIQ